MTMRKTLLAVATVLLASASNAALAAYPDKPITLIVAYDREGGTDVTARMLAPYIEKYLGTEHRIQIVNLPRLGGEIGFAALAEAAPDGYTIGFINTPNVVTIPIERTASYELAQFDALVNIVEDPSVWTVHADSAFQSLADVVTYAKAHPRKVTVGTTGSGSDDDLATSALEAISGARFAALPFSGSAGGMRALKTGKMTVSGHNLGEAIRASAATPLRVLGVMSAERSPAAPDIPTFREQGYDIVMSSMRGIAAPKGLPEDIRSKLIGAITMAATDPGFQAKAAQAKTFQPLRILGPEAYTQELKDMDAEYRARWTRTSMLMN